MSEQEYVPGVHTGEVDEAGSVGDGQTEQTETGDDTAEATNQADVAAEDAATAESTD